MDFLIDLLGILGIIAAVVAFQCKKHSGVLGFRTANEVFFGIQFLLLGAWTGVAMNTVGSIRNIIFASKVKGGRPTKKMVALFSLFFLVFGIVTWEGAKSLLVIPAKIISTAAYGNPNLLLVRLLILLTSTAWLIYDLFSGSYAGVVCEVLTQISIYIAIFRYHIPHKNKEKSA